MSYIKSYNTYFPRFAIADNILHPKGRKHTHSLAYADEDIITLAYAACCTLDREVDAVLFATTTPVFKQRYHASYLADLLGLPEGILALDMSATNRAGTDALLLADALANSGKYNNILVVASDIRFPETGQEAHTPFGHAAVAIIVSNQKGLAELNNTRSFSSALAEEFEYKEAKVFYDARFARKAGFVSNVKQALANLNPNEIDKLIINSAYVKHIYGTLKKAGFDLEKQMAPDHLIPCFGYLGVAHALLRMIHAIENVQGSIVLIDYNNGSNVIAVEIQQAVNQTKYRESISLASYQDYLLIRKNAGFGSENYKSAEMFSSEMMQKREKEQLIHLIGFKCKSCQTVYYLKSARCKHCGGSEFSKKPLAKEGIVYSLTSEYYFPSPFPPTNMVVVDLAGGGRITLQQTDDMYQDEISNLQIGDKVNLVLRKMMPNDNKPNYFWKCVKTSS